MDGLGYLQVVSWVLGLILVVCTLCTPDIASTSRVLNRWTGFCLIAACLRA
jgi:hypothetical protein